MERNTALGAAAGVTLAVVGAVSALFMTMDQPADAASLTTPAVEYVDQYGNPLGAPAAGGADAAMPDVVVVNPDGTLADAPAAGYDEDGEEAEYDEHGEEAADDEHDEAEYEEDDEADDYEDGDEYDEADDDEDGDDDEDSEEEEDDHDD